MIVPPLTRGTDVASPHVPGVHECTPMSILATKEISMSEVSSIENPVEVGGEYREQVLTVEPHGIEQVSASERHGRPRALFTLWLSANMGLPVWLVGALAIVFGLGFADGVIAILIGNIIGCSLLALTASMRPEIFPMRMAITPSAKPRPKTIASAPT